MTGGTSGIPLELSVTGLSAGTTNGAMLPIRDATAVPAAGEPRAAVAAAPAPGADEGALAGLRVDSGGGEGSAPVVAPLGFRAGYVDGEDTAFGAAAAGVACADEEGPAMAVAPAGVACAGAESPVATLACAEDGGATGELPTCGAGADEEG
jgi:hypothetical protein